MVAQRSGAIKGLAGVLVIITWTMVLICLRMLFVVAQPVLRVGKGKPWLVAFLLLTFALVFFYRPAIAYYWFWGTVLYELGRFLYYALFASRDSLRSWLRRKLDDHPSDFN